MTKIIIQKINHLLTTFSSPLDFMRPATLLLNFDDITVLKGEADLLSTLSRLPSMADVLTKRHHFSLPVLGAPILQT